VGSVMGGGLPGRRRGRGGANAAPTPYVMRPELSYPSRSGVTSHRPQGCRQPHTPKSRNPVTTAPWRTRPPLSNVAHRRRSSRLAGPSACAPRPRARRVRLAPCTLHLAPCSLLLTPPCLHAWKVPPMPEPAPVVPEDRSSPLLVSLEEAARLLGLSEKRVRALCQQGVLDSRREGRRRLVRYTSLREYAEGA
jgi:excisionase family DNA binding protein